MYELFVRESKWGYYLADIEGNIIVKHLSRIQINQIRRYQTKREKSLSTKKSSNNNFKKCPNCDKSVYPDQFNNYVCENCGWSPDD